MRRCAVVVAILSCSPWFTVGARAQGRFDLENNTLSRAIDSIVENVVKLGKKEHFTELAVGLFNDNVNPNNTAGSGLKKALIDGLRKAGFKVVGRAGVTIKGEYSILEGHKTVEGTDQVFAVARISFQLLRQGQAFFDSERDLALANRPYVSNPEDVSRLGGLNATIDPTRPASENARRMIRGEDGTPEIEIKGTVFRPRGSPYALEMLVAKRVPQKTPKSEDYKPREVTLRDGRPFLRVSPGEVIAIKIINQSDYDAAVKTFIDGLSLFAFCEDKQITTDFVIQNKLTQSLCLGWFRTRDKADAFQVAELPSDDSDAPLLKNPSEIGSITVAFAAAWEKDEDRPRDEPSGRAASLEIRQGPAVDVDYTLVKRHIGVIRSSITIRYDR